MATARHGYKLEVCLTLMLFGKFALPRQLSLSFCPTFHNQWNQLIQDNLQHLCRMSGQFPPHCVSEMVDLMFPRLVLTARNSDGITIIYEILQHLFYFLSKDHPQDIWNSTCIQKLQNDLYQQMKVFNMCLDEAEMNKGLTNCETPASYSTTLKVKRYFQQINSFLTDEQHSQCAWEMVHLEMKRCFLYITQLLQKLT
ncbi:interferon kappa [Tiliqua scincoides]|uniref:interferon kappa n=1 Tax=Tiliqua scincoides TaxID=71010 RepID=UPI0034625178